MVWVGKSLVPAPVSVDVREVGSAAGKRGSQTRACTAGASHYLILVEPSTLLRFTQGQAPGPCTLVPGAAGAGTGLELQKLCDSSNWFASSSCLFGVCVSRKQGVRFTDVSGEHSASSKLSGVISDKPLLEHLAIYLSNIQLNYLKLITRLLSLPQKKMQNLFVCLHPGQSWTCHRVFSISLCFNSLFTVCKLEDAQHKAQDISMVGVPAVTLLPKCPHKLAGTVSVALELKAL